MSRRQSRTGHRAGEPRELRQAGLRVRDRPSEGVLAWAQGSAVESLRVAVVRKNAGGSWRQDEGRSPCRGQRGSMGVGQGQCLRSGFRSGMGSPPPGGCAGHVRSQPFG